MTKTSKRRSLAENPKRGAGETVTPARLSPYARRMRRQWLVREWCKGGIWPFSGDSFDSAEPPIKHVKGDAAPRVKHGEVWQMWGGARHASTVWHIEVGHNWDMFRYIHKPPEELAAMVALLKRAGAADDHVVHIDHMQLQQHQLHQYMDRLHKEIEHTMIYGAMIYGVGPRNVGKSAALQQTNTISPALKAGIELHKKMTTELIKRIP